MKCVRINYNPLSLFVGNDELWVGGSGKGIFVYNLQLEQIKHIEYPQLKWVTNVVKTPTGVIVSDSDTGVHHLNHQGEYTNRICFGFFSDVCLTSDNKMYALDYKQGEIHIFITNENSWVKDTQFKLVQYSDGRTGDKLCTTSTHLYVSCWQAHCILVYTLGGEYVFKTGGPGGEVAKFDRPFLSDVDSGGKILVCDWHNHSLLVWGTQKRVWSKFSGLEGVEYPRCAGLRDKYLWVSAGLNEKQLLKFKLI